MFLCLSNISAIKKPPDTYWMIILMLRKFLQSLSVSTLHFSIFTFWVLGEQKSLQDINSIKRFTLWWSSVDLFFCECPPPHPPPCRASLYKSFTRTFKGELWGCKYLWGNHRFSNNNLSNLRLLFDYFIFPFLFHILNIGIKTYFFIKLSMLQLRFKLIIL